MNTVTKMIAAGMSTIALACGIGAGIAYADPSSPSPTPTPTASASPTPTAHPNPDRPRTKRPRGLLARALHGEVTLAGKEHRVVAFQRGSVEKVSDTSLTVKSPDGYTATYVVSADTKVRKKAGKATIGDLKPGARVFVVAEKDGSTLTARRVRVIVR